VAETVKVGLLGYGTVGQALVGLLAEFGSEVEAKTGYRFQPVAALVREPHKSRPNAPPLPLVDSLAELFAHRPDVLVDAMGGIQPALAIYRQAIREGCPVVSANKELLAAHGPELTHLAAQQAVAIAYEACVAAGTPVVAPLADHLALLPVTRIRAVVNGTTNFILHALEGGREFEEALAEAQRLGFAEADPTNDLSGLDAVRKLVLLARLAWNAEVYPAEVPVFGIANLRRPALERLVQRGLTVRLLAQAQVLPDRRLDLSVAPHVFPLTHPFARLSGADNVVEVEAATGVYRFMGPGAGGRATAQALLADLVRVSGGRRYPAASGPSWRVAGAAGFTAHWLLVRNGDGEAVPRLASGQFEEWSPGVYFTAPLSAAEVDRALAGLSGITALVCPDPQGILGLARLP
jgi:homoserine dehydrogenase